MITKRLLNGGGQLFVRRCTAPFYRVGSSFKIPYLGDQPISGERPSPDELAVPNGFGYMYDERYVFRRIDRVWITIADERLAKLVSEAVENWVEGVELTFEELQGVTGAESSLLVVAYSAGILGQHTFKTAPESFKAVRIEDGWFEDNLFEFMVYRDGLAVYEVFQRSLPHVATAYRTKRIELCGVIDDNRLEAGDVVVEDEHLIEIAESSVGLTVGEVLKSCSSVYAEEVMWGLAVLAGLGCINFV